MTPCIPENFSTWLVDWSLVTGNTMPPRDPNDARSAIGDSGEKQRLIKTLPRKGFRFVGMVQEAQRSVIAPATANPGAQSLDNIARLTPAHTAVRELDLPAHSRAASPRLSIVVLPFTNIGGDPEQDYFVDGVTESLTTDLSRIDGSFVIGRHTAFTYKAKPVDLKQIGRELSVRYLLEGSVQRDGNRLRVNVQLIDAETGNHLWAERFDRPVAHLFDMQDEIVSRLANMLDAQLIAAEARRAERSLHPDAMDFYFRGVASWNKGLTSEYMAQARGFFEQALALDPGNIGAMVGVARVDASVAGAYLTDDRAAHHTAAETASTRALSHAPNHALAHLALGAVLIWTNRAAQGIAECERALALDRNLAHAHGLIGCAKTFMGRGAETEAHINEALRLSPRDIFAVRWFVYAGFAKVQLNADAEAVSWLRRSVETNRNYPLAHFGLATALALLGRLDEARAAAQAGLALDPSFTIRRFRLGVASDNPTYLAKRECFYEGMRLARVPEG
jgi:TolB-like protein/tetratricopeptide (TPR) repeat protein